MYRIQQQRHTSLFDYIDFLRRARWKSYRVASRMQQVGNYLSITVDSARSLGENTRKEQTVVRMGHGVRRGTPQTAGVRLCKCKC